VIQVIGAREVALRVHVHESNVSRWAAGQWLPSYRARVALEQHCQIPRESWEMRTSDLDSRRGSFSRGTT
jgi:hypothetical protein